MGLNYSSALFLIGEKRRGIDFSNMLTLGRQGIYMSSREYQKIMKLLRSADRSPTGYADHYFQSLGANRLDFMDASPYEGATFLHDLNNPLPIESHGLWSVVFDGGTLEHVFNFPEAIRSCMLAVRKGGHFISVTPWNNFAGHGFYQFSPELFYRIFSPENGYQVERMLISKRGSWFSVTDPNALGTRVQYFGKEETSLYISARRISDAAPLANWPQQSDYSNLWSSLPKDTLTIRTSEKAKAFLIASFPMLEELQLRWRSLKKTVINKRMPRWAKRISAKDDTPG